VTHLLASELRCTKTLALVIMGLAAVAAPIAGSSPVSSAHLQRGSPAKPVRPPGYLVALGTVTANTVVVTPRLDGQLLSVNFKEGGLVQKGQLLASIEAKPYQLQLAAAQGLLTRDQARLAAAAAQASQEQDRGAIAQLRAAIEANETKVETAKRQLSYAEITAPLTGLAGFRQIDVGNIVHAGDRLVAINQLQPIAVLFNIQQDELPRVLARLNTGVHPTVVLLNRDGGTKILATGHLVAADNQIDTQSGTVTLKAIFDNNDGALFPNQFVNVRLLLNTPSPD
jgi:multidrug efflux system membrane fusion protein